MKTVDKRPVESAGVHSGTVCLLYVPRVWYLRRGVLAAVVSQRTRTSGSHPRGRSMQRRTKTRNSCARLASISPTFSLTDNPPVLSALTVPPTPRFTRGPYSLKQTSLCKCFHFLEPLWCWSLISMSNPSVCEPYWVILPLKSSKHLTHVCFTRVLSSCRSYTVVAFVVVIPQYRNWIKLGQKRE